MNVLILLLLISGVVLLVTGAELLVRGASRIAAAAGVRPLVIGLTVVAFGTSAPELAVSLLASFNDQPDIAVGNIVGSNIFNVLFILGAAAVIVPLTVQKQIVRLEVPIMVLVSVALMIVAVDGAIGRLDGFVLFAGLIVYIVYLGRGASAAAAADIAGMVQEPRSTKRILLSAALAVVGLVLLVMGSRFFVNGAVDLARLLGVSEVVIGLTIIAAGTSLPELATSVVAGMRGERDIAVGNVVGSNIFNILGILGVCGLVTPEPLVVHPAMYAFDIPVMIGVAILALPVVFTGSRITRGEGLLFLVLYGAYTAFLVLRAMQHAALDEFTALMVLFVLPVTALVVTISTARFWRDARRAERGLQT